MDTVGVRVVDWAAEFPSRERDLGEEDVVRQTVSREGQSLTKGETNDKPTLLQDPFSGNSDRNRDVKR